jgi:hypothetical protein
MTASATEMVRRAAATLGAALGCVRPEAVSGREALELAEAFARAERVAAAGKALFARQVGRTGAHEAAGHRDTASWLARVSGEPVGKARDQLATTEKIERLPVVARAFADGEISGAEAGEIARAAAWDPTAVPGLVRVAKEGSFSDVKAQAALVTRRARGEEAEETAEARAHRGRFARVYPDPSGGMRLEAWLTRRDGSRLKAALDAEAEVLFRQTGGDTVPHTQLAADALVRLVCGGPRHEPELGCSGPSAHVVVRVDAGALRRGAVRGTEVCEIAGVGPVPVRLARELLGDALLTVVVRDGVDIRTVTGTRRTIPRTLRAALFERDRVCCVPGCHVERFLEIDHWRRDYALGGPTSIDNLARLCGAHHAMKTNLGWRLAGGPGRWRWLPPTPAFRRRT